MSKDLINDRYGRFYEIPLELSKLGHDVIGITLSYRKRDEGLQIDESSQHGSFQWYSYNLTNFILPNLIRYQNSVKSIIESFNADIIWACSDSIHAIIGQHLSKKTSVPYIVDLYDNFESYKLTHIPGILPLFKRATHHAAAVTCISQTLADYVINNYHPKGEIDVIENAVPQDLFKPMERDLSRQYLDLPVNAQFIGTAGALNNERGIDILFRGYEQLASMFNNLHLLIAGPIGKHVNMPKGEKVHYLNNLPYDKVPYLINALDLAVVCNRDSDFGRFCFPQKIYEFMACQTPFIAAAVGATEALLKNHPYCLYKADDLKDFIRIALQQLKQPKLTEQFIPTWKNQAEKLESIARIITSAHVNKN
jgi:glycosyltransferase involved in cell wall biosynthesis